MKKLLVIDDELGTRESVREIFFNIADVVMAENAIEGLDVLSKDRIDLIILDLVMPGLSGIDFLKETRETYPEIPIIIVSASPAATASKEGLELGAIGFLKKPFDLHELRALVQRYLLAPAAPAKAADDLPVGDIVGESPSFKETIAKGRNAARTKSSVLLIGEPGTGKEMLARQIHSWSMPLDEAFVSVHCGKIPRSTLTEEIFGSERAVAPCRGAFDLAGNGTIFLIQIEKLPESVQSLLGDAIQHHQFSRDGASEPEQTKARIIATSRRSLAVLAPALSLGFPCTIDVPPLRERPGDVPLLVYHFLNKLGPVIHAETSQIDADAMARLCDYSWPGNVRELRGVIERMLVRFRNEDCIHLSAVSEELEQPSETLPSLQAGTPR